MYQATRLENGLTVATAEMPHMASVSLGIWVGVGGRCEAEEVGGISHFIEHMLFKGTKRRTARDISQAVEGIGGYLNAFTSEEHTCFYAKAGHGHFEDLLEVLTDMFLHSTFDAGELAKEREVIKEELAMYLDQPQQYVQELLNAALWPGQPLGRSITGTVKTLDAISRERMFDFQRSHYMAEGVVIAAAGRLRHAEVLRAVGRRARQFPGGPRPRFEPVTGAQERPVVRLHTKKTEQTQIALGVRACSRHQEQRFALRLLNAVLGENMSSRLFQTVREEKGLAYSIYSGNSFFDDTGDLVISAGLDLGNLEKTLKIILREIGPGGRIAAGARLLDRPVGFEPGKQREPNDVGGGAVAGLRQNPAAGAGQTTAGGGDAAAGAGGGPRVLPGGEVESGDGQPAEIRRQSGEVIVVNTVVTLRVCDPCSRKSRPRTRPNRWRNWRAASRGWCICARACSARRPRGTRSWRRGPS
jgi:predicted Zn-dependent peptidase